MDNLVERAKEKDADAFTKLMQSQMQNMYKTAIVILYNEEDAADAISETILTCWEKMGQLRQTGYFRTWMTRILINKCSDILQKRKPFQYAAEIPDTPYFETGYENREWKEALSCLDEKYRLVMILYYVEGFHTTEIGTILDLPESTVRTRLARGREKLARDYDSQWRRKQI